MKRNLIATAAILLTLVMLTGCAAPAELTRGTIEDNVYTNESAELTFTAPEGWKYLTDDEIAVMLGIGADKLGQSKERLTDETFKEVNIYDMMATDTATNTSVAVMYQNLAAAPGTKHFNEETLLDFYKEQMSKNTFFNCEFSDFTEAKIGSNTFKVMSAYYTDNGTTQNYYIRRTGDYMLIIVATKFGDDDIDSIMANFS